MTGVFLQEVLRILNCMTREEFDLCWGDMGGYLWNKFELKEFEVFDFVCYLDPGNAQKLVKYAGKQMSVDILSWTEEQWDRERAAEAKLFEGIKGEALGPTKPGKFIVRRMQNLAACDTFDENSVEPTQRKLGKWEFDTFEEAEKFFNERKAMTKFAGLAGEYYTYPVKKEK